MNESANRVYDESIFQDESTFFLCQVNQAFMEDQENGCLENLFETHGNEYFIYRQYHTNAFDKDGSEILFGEFESLEEKEAKQWVLAQLWEGDYRRIFGEEP